MEKRTDGKIVAVVALFVAVVGLSIGFASLTATLNINGSATVKSQSWSVEFANLKNAALTGEAEEATKPQISADSTKIETYSVNFKQPGDSVSYEFDVKNAGTIDAEITSLSVPTPTCSAGDDSVEATVCSKLSYTLTYKDNGTSVQQNDMLAAAGEQPTTRTMVLKLSFDENKELTSSQLPTEDVTIENLGVIITYGQAD